VLSNDPYNAGWLIRAKIADNAALAKLLDYDAYQKQCSEDG
jgi:glycine cleavage system H protein